MRRHPTEERDRLRRLTVYVAIAAIGLNAVLFLQSAAGWLGSGDVGGAIVSLIAGIFPGSGVAAPNTNPSPAPGATPIAVSGGS
ncbi:MAG: hypothetical protein QOI23_223 [Chloroflexota bacterium]|nr:hypothetical protein [Chloroflexota bacterium]